MALPRLQKQTLSTSYGAALTLPEGARDVSVTLNTAIQFTVQDQADTDNEEHILAGASWLLGTSEPIQGTVVIKIKCASGAPVATLRYFT